MKSYTEREMNKILLNNGFEFVSSKGGHRKYRRDRDTVIINKNLKEVVANRIIKENRLVLA